MIFETLYNWTDWHIFFISLYFWCAIAVIIAIVYGLYRFIHRHDDVEPDENDYDDEYDEDA